MIGAKFKKISENSIIHGGTHLHTAFAAYRTMSSATVRGGVLLAQIVYPGIVKAFIRWKFDIPPHGGTAPIS